MEGILTWGGKGTDDILQNHTHETYIIVLTNFIPKNSIKIKK